MRVILLRHEKRGSDIGFFSNLTDEGIFDAMMLPKKLEKYNIDEIFVSPFTRTLETSFFISKLLNKKVNVEYALYEYLHNIYFSIVEWYHTPNDLKNDNLKHIINYNYKSIIKKDDFTVLEDDKNLEKRIIPFFDYLLNNFNNKTVLLISHQGVLNKIKDLYIKKTDSDDYFEMGSFEIYDIN
jgi:broad specificity phosphatase PhoE